MKRAIWGNNLKPVNRKRSTDHGTIEFLLLLHTDNFEKYAIKNQFPFNDLYQPRMSVTQVNRLMIWLISNILIYIRKLFIYVKRAGGPRSIFTFWIILIEKNASYQELFSVWKNIVRSQRHHNLKSRKYVLYPESQFKIYLLISYSFWDGGLKLGNYVLWTETKS